jgi:hypothetical protein
LKAILEQRPQHRDEPVGPPALRVGRDVTAGLRDDVEAINGDPRGAADELIEPLNDQPLG